MSPGVGPSPFLERNLQMRPRCNAPDCTRPARSAAAELCPMHYHRKYRHGSLDRAGANLSVIQGRYRSAYMPSHPLAMTSGKVYVHRMVLYDAIGPGTHSCHWCSTRVVWETLEGDPVRLHVDHLNRQRDDNRPENLVPSCKRCNVTRGSQARHEALVAAGFWSKHDTIARLSTGGRRAPLKAA